MNDIEIVICCNCGFEYLIIDTEPYSNNNLDERICNDCIEGDNDW